MFFLSILSLKEVIFRFRDENKTLELIFYMKDLAHKAPYHHCFSNTVIGWSFGVCVGAEELAQWYADRRDFLANWPLFP